MTRASDNHFISVSRHGELMARLPVDPRVARLLVVANKNDALREGLVIAAALSVVDPREYGVDPDAARRKHEVFADARSEFTSRSPRSVLSRHSGLPAGHIRTRAVAEINLARVSCVS